MENPFRLLSETLPFVFNGCLLNDSQAQTCSFLLLSVGELCFQRLVTLFSSLSIPLKRRRAAFSSWCIGRSRFCSAKKAGGWAQPHLQTLPNELCFLRFCAPFKAGSGFGLMRRRFRGVGLGPGDGFQTGWFRSARVPKCIKHSGAVSALLLFLAQVTEPKSSPPNPPTNPRSIFPRPAKRIWLSFQQIYARKSQCACLKFAFRAAKCIFQAWKTYLGLLQLC